MIGRFVRDAKPGATSRGSLMPAMQTFDSDGVPIAYIDVAW